VLVRRKKTVRGDDSTTVCHTKTTDEQQPRHYHTALSHSEQVFAVHCVGVTAFASWLTCLCQTTPPTTHAVCAAEAIPFNTLVCDVHPPRAQNPNHLVVVVYWENDPSTQLVFVSQSDTYSLAGDNESAKKLERSPMALISLDYSARTQRSMASIIMSTFPGKTVTKSTRENRPRNGSSSCGDHSIV